MGDVRQRITTAEDGVEPPLDGKPDRPRPADELTELRRANQRLALALQIERERNRRLEELVGEPVGDLELVDEPAPSITDWLPWPRVAIGEVRRRLAALAEHREAPGVAWSGVTVWEAGALAVIVLLAVLLRFWDVAHLPAGFQGDEATAGLLGQRIRAEGWIGPYTTLAAGSPTGFYYVVAISMAIIDDVFLAIRVVPALFGVLAIPALYFLVRRTYGAPVALAAAFVLATLGWHIHYSRIAFPNIAWPFVVLLALLALTEAVRREDWRWWSGAGALFGLGVYTYNSHILLMGLVAAAVGFHLFGWVALAAPAAYLIYAERPGFLTLCLLAIALVAFLADRRVQDRHRLVRAAVFAGAFLLVAWPMIRYIADDAHDYFGYGRRLSIFNSPEWAEQAGPVDQAAFVAGRYREYWDRLCCHPRFDGVDATGVTAVVPLPTLLLAAVGIAFALARGHRIAASLGVTIVLVMPLASALSVDFAVRRSLVVTVFVALFAGLGLIEATRWAWRRGLAIALPASAALLLLLTLSVYRNLDNYFAKTVESQPMHWVMAVEMVDASQYVATLEPDTYVYFYSERWPWSHEHRRFFAPAARGEDRSEQFGTYDFATDPTAGRPVFLFMGRYRGDVVQVETRYPGGETILAGDPEDPDFVVYLPPWPPDGSADPPPEAIPVETPVEDPATRG